MNPIEYTAPGRPSVWACGNCNRVCASAVSCGPQAWTNDLAESSREQAERCCICDCGKPTDYAISRMGRCAECQAKHEMQMEKIDTIFAKVAL
jgi:hypothetical protein